MNTHLYFVFALLTGQAVVDRTAVAPSVPEVTIKTRRTYDRPDASLVTTIVHVKGARVRRETIVELPPMIDARSSGTRKHADVQVTQCDARRTLMLDADARTYAVVPLVAARIDPRPTAGHGGRSEAGELSGDDVTVTIDAVDTGERRAVGGYVARRVITETTIAPGPGARIPRSRRTQDGWYLDLPEIDCSEPANQSGSFIFAALQGPDTPRDRIHVTRRGNAPRGFPIEETDRTTESPLTVSARISLLEFVEGPLPDSLFTVPAEYRPALPLPFGTYDMTRPDTIANRLHSYWDGLSVWVASRLGAVWQ